MMKFLKKIWNDPVGASIISSIVIFLLTQIGAVLLAYFGTNNFTNALKIILSYDVKIWVLILIIFGFLLLRGLVVKYGVFRYDSHSYEIDKAVYDTILSELSYDGIIQFLRTNNFAGSAFRLSSLDELYDFYDTHVNDPSFGFFNPKLEEMRIKLMNNIDEFNGLIAVNTFPTSHEGMQTVPPEWETQCPEHFLDVVNKIHNKAESICSDYDMIVKTGKRVIKM